MKKLLTAIIIAAAPAGLFFLVSCSDNRGQVIQPDSGQIKDSPAVTEPLNVLDTAAYMLKLKEMSNGDTTGRWPVKNRIPLPGAILPFNRVIAYYGNLYSKQMGILGELPEDSMLAKLRSEVAKWNNADTSTPAIPALHYIAVTAQNDPGKAGKYRLRMPFHQIDRVLEMAKKIDALVFIDIQIGLATIQEELPEFEKYLAMPNVHLGIDPEFFMKTGKKPGSVIGSFDAADINYVQQYLSEIVKKNNLPPKILVVHRFTQAMVKNTGSIKHFPEVQFVMDMDGWGIPAKKVNTYRQFIYREPVEFTGFKIFYKNDTKRVGVEKEMQPADLLKLQPRPVYIQYQ